MILRQLNFPFGAAFKIHALRIGVVAAQISPSTLLWEPLTLNFSFDNEIYALASHKTASASSYEWGRANSIRAATLRCPAPIPSAAVSAFNVINLTPHVFLLNFDRLFQVAFPTQAPITKTSRENLPR